ncbi:MAG: hypothetical protein JWR84_2415 [Caulobacter sp.]|nr:hypothetical protein [Caulobacter sp.]
MIRTILIAGAAIAALSLAACSKPADKTTETTDTTAVTEGAADAGGASGHADGTGGVDTSGGATADGGGSSTGGVTASDAGTSPTVGSGAPTVDTSKGPATATTPTAKVPLETDRKNNPPPNQ